MRFVGRWPLAMSRRSSSVRLALKVFNPFQPRVPAGTREGERWSGDSTSDGADDDSLIRPAAGRERDRICGGELAKDSCLNRHIVDRHVGKTDAEMIKRVADSCGRELFGLRPST
jgi:hypothetical protein